MKVESQLTREQILEKVSPYDIFAMYMPWEFTINRRCRNPLVSKDNTPSFIIGNKSQTGELIFKAFNSEHRGDCFIFVEKMFNLDYFGALNKIAEDFGLKDRSNLKYKAIIDNLPKPKIEMLKPILIQAKIGKYEQIHLDYLAKYTLEPKDLNFCLDTKVGALKEWWLNRTKQVVKKNELAFVYNYTDEFGSWNKVYFPNREKKDKWRSSIPFQKIHGFSNIKDCKTAILTKSIKDGALIAKYITSCVCVIQAEDSAAISPENVEFLKNSVESLYIGLDSDNRGKTASRILCKLLDAKHINIPDRLLEKGATDFSDWVALEGKEPLIEHFHKKGII